MFARAQTILLVETGEIMEGIRIVETKLLSGKTINCQNPKGRHTKKAIKLLIAAKKDDDEQIDRLDKYMDYLDEMTAECTGMSVEDLDELDNDDKTTLVSFYQDRVEGRLDFLKSSLKRGSSAPRDGKESSSTPLTKNQHGESIGTTSSE